jgi:ABC-2 type transport system permease protein
MVGMAGVFGHPPGLDLVVVGPPSRYLAFILPGTLVMAVPLVTMYAGIGLNADIAGGISDRFRALPVWRAAPIAGARPRDIARYLLVSALVTVLGLVIGYRPAGGVPGVLAGTGLLSGHAAIGRVAWVLIAAAIVTAVFAPLTAWLYGRPR